MSRVPTTNQLADLQQSFRELWNAIAPWTGTDSIDFKGRRITNAGTAVETFDYATKNDVQAAVSAIQTAVAPIFTGLLTNANVIYGTHATRLVTIAQKAFFVETDRSNALYGPVSDGTWLLIHAMGDGSYSAKPGDLTTIDGGYWYYAQDQSTLSRWSGASWHYQVGNLINAFANRPAASTAIGTGFRFTVEDRGFQEYWHDRGNVRWVFAGGGQPTQGVLASITGSLGTYDAGYQYYATDFDRLYVWNGSAYQDAPGQPARDQVVLFNVDPGTGWHLCDGSTVTQSKSDGTTASITLPQLTNSTYYLAAGASVASSTFSTTGTDYHDATFRPFYRL